MVIIDNSTGYVVGISGGMGEQSSTGLLNRLNRATQSKRQTGSAMKPLAVIAPGLEAGVITAATVYDDSPTTFKGYPSNWPKNYYTSYKGLSTVRYAIEISQNIVPAKILSEITPSKSLAYLKKMGITSLDDVNDNGLSLALGGLYNGVSPLEMAAAYAMIANKGQYIQPTFYTKVTDRDGNIVYEPNREYVTVISEDNAYIEQSILTQPVVGSSGTATYCKISGIDVAAKTGTTSDDKDRWLCGFTPYYTAVAWYGYDTPAEIVYKVNGASKNPSGLMWAAVMKDIHKGLPNKKFEKTSNIVTATICKDTGKVATDKCTNKYTEVFVKGTVPGKCNGHVTQTICTATGKLATEYCPDTETRVVTDRPEKEKNASKWTTNSGSKYNLVKETCSDHKAPTPIPTIEPTGTPIATPSVSVTPSQSALPTTSPKQTTQSTNGNSATPSVTPASTQASSNIQTNKPAETNKPETTATPENKKTPEPTNAKTTSN